MLWQKDPLTPATSSEARGTLPDKETIPSLLLETCGTMNLRLLYIVLAQNKLRNQSDPSLLCPTKDYLSLLVERLREGASLIPQISYRCGIVAKHCDLRVLDLRAEGLKAQQDGS